MYILEVVFLMTGLTHSSEPVMCIFYKSDLSNVTVFNLIDVKIVNK